MVTKKFISIIKNKLLYKRKISKLGSSCYFGKNLTIVGGEHIYIGDRFCSGDNLKLQAWSKYLNKVVADKTPELILKNDVTIMDNCHISCAKRIEIGNGVLLGDNVFITDNFHGRGTEKELEVNPIRRELYLKGDVVIGNNVWIGRNACIMPGVEIGEGAIIGANAVVTKNVNAFSVVGGVPAKVLYNE